MTISQMIWFAGLLVGSIASNVGLLKIITDDKLRRPNTVAAFVNIMLSLVGGSFGYLLVGGLVSITFVSFNIVSFLVIVYITTRRNVTAVIFAEKLLVSLKTIDLQISFIISELGNGKSDDLSRAIRRSLRYIISELPSLIGLDQSHHPEISLLVPQNNKFKVLAYSGIENYRVDKMEALYQYGTNTVSIAGHVMNQRFPVVLNSLAADTEQQYWIRTVSDNPKTGSILAYPVLRAVNSTNSDPIAVLSVTSAKENAFRNSEQIINLLAYFSQKIEILLNCIELINTLDSRKTTK